MTPNTSCTPPGAGLWIWNRMTTTTTMNPTTEEDGARGPWRSWPFLFVLLGNVPGHVFWFNPCHNNEMTILFNNKVRVRWSAWLSDKLETRHIDCVWLLPPSPSPPLVDNTDIKTMNNGQAENINDDTNGKDGDNALLPV